MLKSSVKCVSKKYDFTNMNNGISNIYDSSTYCGEDAWFIEGNIVGVADGVSGWITKGVSSAFSNSLMLECKKYSKCFKNPIEILEKAYIATKNNVIGGSSTACIVSLDSFTLNVCNHGDSGLIVIRNKKIIYRTTRDQIKQDVPYQLGKWDLNEDNIDLNEHNECVNKLYNQVGRRIDDTKLYVFDVQIDDICIVATDGFFDNITDNEIIGCCDSNNLASELIKKAIHNTIFKNDPRCIDDITIIVSKIINDTETNGDHTTHNKRQKIEQQTETMFKQ